MSSATCLFPDCGRASWARGYCTAHYKHYREGKTLKPLKVYEGPDKSFDSCYKVVDLGYTTPCWKWTCAINGEGYGTIFVGGRNMGAHVYSYKRFKGKIKKGNVVRHLCHNRVCVNPDHLEQGTYKQNSQDMIAAGRRPLVLTLPNPLNWTSPEYEKTFERGGVLYGNKTWIINEAVSQPENFVINEAA